MIEKDYSAQHKRNIISEVSQLFNRVEAGDIIRFKYKGTEVNDPEPLVLVLNPRWHNKLHGLNINNIPDKVIGKLKELIRLKISQRVRQLTGLRLNILKADIKEPYRFYYGQLKQFINSYFGRGRTPYRTFDIKGITHVRKIDYRFQDFYSPDKI